MKISEVIDILGAKVICGGKLTKEVDVNSAFGADMMSDALAYVDENTLFLTSMVNPHVIRTAEMLDLHCIVFVRGKQIPCEMIEMAEALDLILLSTRKTMFDSCGLLYAKGLRGRCRDGVL